MILETKSISYDDVNLIAQPTQLVSRHGIPKDLSKIIVSPMDAIVGVEFAIEALNLGLTVCLPRFNSIEDQKKILHKIYDKCGAEDIRDGYKDLFIAVGLDDWDRVNALEHKSILIDVANGYMLAVADFANKLQRKSYRIMCGNVHSAKGSNLYNGVKLRVGIGGGSVCQTSQVTGYTRGQLTEISDCINNSSTNNDIIADGGIRDSGCAAKAFGVGALFVMMGGYFKCAEEAKNIINGEYKYWGGASHTQQIKQYGEIRRHSEGRETAIDKNTVKPLKVLVDDLWGGISSAISYSGYRNLTQFRGNGVFELKYNSNTIQK